jgi:NAD(P)-dependent dehydrogenase (short-subunit alcohol dehydrogenase family)
MAGHGKTQAPDRRLIGKVGIVTGGARGLGEAVARAYARAGAHLVICSRTGPEVETTAEMLQASGAHVMGFVADVSNPEDVDLLVRRTLEAYGRVDILVNNAGILPARRPLREAPVEDWEQTMAVNLRGPFLCVKAVLPAMVRQKGGSIINVSSGLGRSSVPGYGVYGVSKWGLEGLTRYLADEVGQYGVRVNSVSPGMVATTMTSFAGARPESVVDLFVYLASDASKRVTGQALDATAWCPPKGW